MDGEFTEMDATLTSGYDTPPPIGGAGHFDQPPHSLYRQITLPRLLPATPALLNTLVPPRLTTVNLCLPVEVVRRRAGAFADHARRQGTVHSMKLWRACYQQAMLTLAREGGRVAAGAPCETLYWEQKGRDYWICATFGSPPAALLQ